MNISIIGCGVYSMAMAKRLAKNNTIIVWSEDPKKVSEFKKTNKVKSIFKDEKFSKNIRLTNDYEECLKDSNVVFIMTSSNYLKDTLTSIKPFITKKTKIVIGSKGINYETQKLPYELVKSILKTNNYAVIAGPSFAIDILNDEILALSVATKKRSIYKTLQIIYNDTNTKLEKINDVIGISISSVLKNIYAIGSGIYSGLGHSEATTSIYLNKVINEIYNILYYYNGEEYTLLSLATLSDTIMTCTDSKSRNYTYGTKFAKNKTAASTYLKSNTVEGYESLKIVYNIFNKKHIKTPLINTLYEIIYEGKNKKELEKELLK